MNLSRFVSLTLAWLAWGIIKPRFIWSLLAAPALAAVVLHWGPELAVRSYGYFLSVVGGAVAAKQVFSNDRLFKQPRLRDRVAAYWASRPGTGITIEGSTGHAYSTGGQGRITVRSPFLTGDTLDEQLAKLRSNFSFLEKELSALCADVVQNRLAFEAALKLEQEFRAQANKRLEETLREVAVGSSLMAYFGFMLILFGGAITTWSPELHEWAH